MVRISRTHSFDNKLLLLAADPGVPSMLLLELFATMRSRRRSAYRYNEEGAEITRRLLELLDATKPKQVETLSPILASGILPQSQRPLRGKER
jgi:hypothetical protein